MFLLAIEYDCGFSSRWLLFLIVVPRELFDGRSLYWTKRRFFQLGRKLLLSAFAAGMMVFLRSSHLMSFHVSCKCLVFFCVFSLRPETCLFLTSNLLII